MRRKTAATLLVLLVMCLVAVGAPVSFPVHAQGAPVLTRGPYLQSVTADSIVIVWETDQAADGVVDYGPTESYGSTITDASLSITRAVTLTGLLPYTLYHYRVGTTGGSLSGDSTFRTAAAPGQGGFSFVAFGDHRSNPADHQSVVDSIVPLAPDFYLSTGDLVDLGSQMSLWDEFFDIEAELMRTAPLFPALGNHDENHANYFDLFHLPGNERWYSFDYGSAHFVVLQVDGYADYGPGSEQYAWFENDLGANDSLWTFVAFHYSPYASASPHTSDLAVRVALQPLIEQHGVDIVFGGHNHDYERSVVNGVTYLVTGGGGAPLNVLEESNGWTVYFESTLHFVRLSIGEYTLEAVGIRPDGSTFDAFAIDKTPAPTIVEIDIRPGNDANLVNVRSRGVIAVAILNDGAVDLAQVDLSTVAFGPGDAGPTRWQFRDVDGDGDEDLKLVFRVAETGIQHGDTAATLSGRLLDGQEILGTDAIRTVPRSRPHTDGKDDDNKDRDHGDHGDGEDRDHNDHGDDEEPDGDGGDGDRDRDHDSSGHDRDRDGDGDKDGDHDGDGADKESCAGGIEGLEDYMKRSGGADRIQDHWHHRHLAWRELFRP